MSKPRLWHGSVRPDARDEHEQFVAWLASDEASEQYVKYGLSSYTLSQSGDELTVSFAVDDPPAGIRFLRNTRMWPEFWEFRSAEATDSPNPTDVRVRWQLGPES